MYKQISIPRQKTHSVAIPSEWDAQEIEVIAFPTQQRRNAPPCQFTVEEMREHVRLGTEEAEAGLGRTNDEVFAKYQYLFK